MVTYSGNSDEQSHHETGDTDMSCGLVLHFKLELFLCLLNQRTTLLTFGENDRYSSIYLFFSFASLCRYHGNSDEVGCFVAARPLSRRNRYFEVRVEHFLLTHDYLCDPGVKNYHFIRGL